MMCIGVTCNYYYLILSVRYFCLLLQGGEIGKSRLPVISPSLPNTPRNRNSSFSDNLLSLLIPTPFRETLWATMALYLGWRLVSRLR
jgi:hypothetical protein